MCLFVALKATPRDMRIPSARTPAGFDLMRQRQCERDTTPSGAWQLNPTNEALEASRSEALNAQRIVLRTLVEKFGGEVVGSALHGHLAQTAGWQALRSDRSVPMVLAALEHAGALTIDVTDETEVILRLTPNGAALLYDMPV
jgi:hypothetical protein